jgi:hypothetical protein
MIQSKTDDCSEAPGRLQRARRTADPENQARLQQEIARQWWRMIELRKSLGGSS